MKTSTKLVLAGAALLALGCGGEEPYEPLGIAEAEAQDLQCDGRTEYTCMEEMFVNIVREFVPDLRDESDAMVVEHGYETCDFLDANDPQWLGDIAAIFDAEGMAPDRVERAGLIMESATVTLCPEWDFLWEEYR